MIDEYYDVVVDRISPEFPMPIMTSPNLKCLKKPGGVANVACQFKHFNVMPRVFHLPDSSIEDVFKSHGLVSVQPPIESTFRLPIKRRFLNRDVQIVRHDIEGPLCGGSFKDIQDHLSATRNSLYKLAAPDIAILSDYNKGYFCCPYSTQQLINWYNSIGVPTLVDPKCGPIDKWKGCTVFKANAKEALELTNIACWETQAKVLYEQLGCSAVVVTHGPDLIMGHNKDGEFHYFPKEAVKARSVVGAGDCFAAFLAMAMAHGFAINEAIEIAWQAGAKYVQGSHNKPVSEGDLCNGIVRPEDLSKRDYKLAFTNGCFDILHEGHIESLKFARSQGEKLVVAVNSDDSVKRLKGPTRPVVPLQHRMAVLAALECVDFVISFDEDTPLEILKKIKPDVIIKGGQYSPEDVVGSELGIKVVPFPMVEGVSTTKILEDRERTAASRQGSPEA